MRRVARLVRQDLGLRRTRGRTGIRTRTVRALLLIIVLHGADMHLPLDNSALAPSPSLLVPVLLGLLGVFMAL